MALALLVVHRISGQVHLNDILSAISAASFATLLPTLAFTAVSFVAMSFYDVMAVHRVAPGRVPVCLSIYAGLVGYAFSNALGFHVFVGGPLRYRIYQTAGLDAGDVGRIVGISMLTFSGGIAAIMGTALLFDPVGVPMLRIVSPADDRLIGLAIMLVLGAALVWLWHGSRQVTVLGWTFLLPSAGSALVQIALGAVDVGATAAALYVLLPADVAPGFASFVLLFVAAIIAGAVSHAPGGLGVLEATTLLGLGAGTRPDVVAALVLFRLTYYVCRSAWPFWRCWSSRPAASAAPSQPGPDAGSPSSAAWCRPSPPRWSLRGDWCCWCRATRPRTMPAWGGSRTWCRCPSPRPRIFWPA